jgi:hypothetical protein
MDEQRFVARLRALDAAVHMVTGGGRNLVNNDEFVTDAAAHFEEWLMRPAPADMATGPMPDPHDAETVADRLGYERCDTFWRGDDGALHRCKYPDGHAAADHACTCGSEPDRR